MATYKIKTKRYIRKYTAAEKLPVSAALIDAQRVVDELCKVPWEQAAATTSVITSHDESDLDANVSNRDRFDAALFCADHANGAHRAYANAACYKIPFPTGTAGKKITSLKVRVTSDAYNAAGARIALVTNSTGVIPTSCAECRGEGAGGIHAAGVAPQTIQTVGGQRYGYPTIADCIFNVSPGEGEYALPTGGLTLGSYLYVFVLMENYNSVRGNWLEGSSCIVNQIEIVTDSAITGWTDGALIDLTVDALTEYNVTRGKVLPELTGDVSGVRALTIRSTGDPTTVTLSNPITPEQSCIGLRTLYAALYERRLNAVTKTVALAENAREGAGFSVQCEGQGASIGRAWRVSDVTDESWSFVCGVSALGFPKFISGRSSYGLVYSYDGATWLRSNRTTGSFASVCFGIARGTTPMLVAVSYGNGIYYSYNGIDWTQSSNTDGNFRSCVFFQRNGISRFVAGGNNTAGMWYSDDGINWTQSNQTTGKWPGLATTYTGRVIAGSYSDNGIIYSDDGINWTQSNQTTGDWKGIASNNSGTIVAAHFGNGIYVSTDNGVNWALKKSGGYWSSVAYGNGVFVAASQASDGLWSSTNGNSWTRVKSGGTYFGVAFGDENFVAAGSSNGLWLSYNDEITSWRLTTAALLVPFAVPVSFRADKVRLDWSGWSGSATSGGKFNVWLKRGTFVQGYPESVPSNPAIYDATQKNVDGYELVGTIDATQAEKTATFDLVNPIDGYFATILLTAFISLDDLNPSNAMNFPQGVATEMDVNADGSSMSGKGTGWKPDITLIG